MFNQYGNSFSRMGQQAANRALILNKDLPLRRLQLHEYQAGKLLHHYRVPIPHGGVAQSGKEALLVARQFAQKRQMEYVVKAQVLGGGRGQGYFKENGYKSGVHIVKTAEEVQDVAEHMCGKSLVTKQSDENGFPCNKVYIVEKLAIDKEFYLSLVMDRKAQCLSFIYSPAGGMSIEQVAHDTPEKIFKVQIDINKGLCIDKLAEVAKNLGVEEHKSQVVFLLKNIYDCFVEKDCDMIEINPLVVTKSG